MTNRRFLILFIVLIFALSLAGLALAAADRQGSGPGTTDTVVNPEKGQPEGTSLTDPLLPVPDGILAATHVYTNSSILPIPDSSCATGYVTSTITVPDSFIVADLNVGLWIPHTWRADLDVRLRGPDGTVTFLIQDEDGSADNVNALIDDASPNIPDATIHNPPPPYYYAWWKTDGLLSLFNGKNSQGVWTIEACDDAGGDIGILTSWTLFFETGLVLNPPVQSGAVCLGGDVHYDYTVVNGTPTTSTFSLVYTSTWPVQAPAVTPLLAPGESWQFQVNHHVPWSASTGDQNTLQVAVSGAGDSDQSTATTTAALVQGYQDFANTPRPTRDHAVVFYNNKLYKIGGYDGAAQAYLDIYDIASNTWSAGAPMPLGRYWVDCVEIGGLIYCAGGYSTTAQSTLYIYDPVTDSWSTGAALPAGRYNYAGVALNGLYYVIGGYTTTYQNTMLVYDPVANTWDVTKPPMSVTRRYFHAGAMGGKIYVAGGYNVSYHSSAEMYDPALNTWSPIASMPIAWNRGGDAVMSDRYMFIYGGSAASTAASTTTVLAYDSQTNTWFYPPVMSHALYATEADGDGNNLWIVSGRLLVGSTYSYSPFTTLMAKCAATCTPVSGVNFTVDPANPLVGWPATFTGSVAAGSPSITWDWIFGDSGTGQGQIIQHTYGATGGYTVQLTATNCDGASTASTTQVVTAILPPTLSLNPAALHSIQAPDTTITLPLDVCNAGDADLTWVMTEVSPTLPAPAWEMMAPLPAGRVFNAVVGAGNYVYVIGGSSDAAGNIPTDSNYRYDPLSNTWTSMAPAPTTLAFMDGIEVGGQIYIPGDAITNTTFVYNIAGDSWTSIPSNNGYPINQMYGLASIGSDLYVLGGIVGGASTPNVWILDTTNNTWSAGVPMQKARINFSVGAINGNLYAAGGVAFPGFAPDMTAEMFNGTAWSYVAPVPNGGGAYTRWSYNADGVGGGMLWLAAGRRDTSWLVLNHAGFYDPQTNTWTESPDVPLLNQGRVYGQGTVVDGYFYVIGGRDSAGVTIYDTNERLLVDFDLPWLSESLNEGTVPGGACTTVDVGFDSAGVTAPAEFFGGLQVETNDPATPLAMVPVTMSVTLAEITFSYNDLEDVVLPGEAVFLVGDFNEWNTTATPMLPNGDSSVFTVTLPLTYGDHEYKYVVYTDTIPSGPVHWDWLQSYPVDPNRHYTVTGQATIQDYRDIVPGYYLVQWPPATATVVGIPTENIYGQIWAWGYTNEGTEPKLLRAELGYGTDADPAAWTTWDSMTWNAQVGDNAEYYSNITPTATGVYSYAVRFNGNWGTGNPNNLWYYGDLNWDEVYNPADAGVLSVYSPDITLVKTVGTDPLTCATTDVITVTLGTSVYYCYTVTNTGDITFTDHTLIDDVLGDLLPGGLAYDLGPGDSYFITATATITGAVVNTAEWTATTSQGFTAIGTDTAQVVIQPMFYRYLPVISKQ